MDWFFNKRRRKKLFRVDETPTEFDILVQRAKQRIVIGERVREFVQLYQRTPDDSQKVSKRAVIARNLHNIRKNIWFLKKL